jgi:APA family basic amino acid/polyamine antiporter
VVAIKVALVLVVIGVGVFYVESANYSPFFPFGLGGALTGAATVFFAVFGYDAMSTAAEESVDAKRHLPKAIIYPTRRAGCCRRRPVRRHGRLDRSVIPAWPA